MKKKIFAISLAAMIAVSTCVGISLAYLTDRDSAENVFTWGYVEIQLNESFENNELIPGKKLVKEATITNTGNNDAWVWMTVAIPASLDNSEQDANVLHVDVPGRFWDDHRDDPEYWIPGQNSAYPEAICWDINYATSKNVEIDGELYNVYTHLFLGPLAVGETSTPCISSVYLDPRVDISPDGELFLVEDGSAVPVDWSIPRDGYPSIYVSAYAIQKDNFADVAEAYAAYADQWGEYGAEYGATVYPFRPQA